jgi:HK97 family phage portal protein
MIVTTDGRAVDFAPQALAETAPLLATGWFAPDTGVALATKFATYGALYRGQPSIATVVDKVANAAARLTFKVWDTTPATGKVQDRVSPYAKLMRSPSSSMSPYNFWRWTFSTYEVYGEAFWVKQRDDQGRVYSLAVMHPSKVSVKRDSEGKLVYVFAIGVSSDGGILEVPQSEVVPFQRYHPDSLMRGLSRLEPLRTTLLNEDAARRATASWWQKGGRPSVALKHPGVLSQPAQDRLRANWEARHAGADNMGGTAILEEGMDAQVIQLTAEEMQYIESRKLNLTEACMVYDVPPPVIHILDHATFSNITEQMRSMYRDTMAPRLEDVESVIDFYLRPEFFPANERDAKFSLDEVLRGDFETRATAVGNLIEKGVYKPSEARPLFDLPQAGPEADVLYGNAALVPLGSSVHGQQEVTPGGELIPSVAPMGEPHPVAPPPPLPKSIAWDVYSRVARVKAVGGDVRRSLVDEHQRALSGYFDQQRQVAKGSGVHNWDAQLALLLADLGAATARTIGTVVAKDLGGQYDVSEITDWLHKNAVDSAGAINATTVAELKSALDPTELEERGEDRGQAIDRVFGGQVAQRTVAIASSRVALVAGLASLHSARQNGAGTKTWVAGPNPRPDHAEMDGETVALNEVFSNGMNAPGDPSGGADEVAGCNCTLTFDQEVAP